MGSSINSVRRRLGTPVRMKLHQSFYMPVPKEIRSLLDLWGWGCATPSASQSRQLSGYISIKRNLLFLQTFRSWVVSRGNLFIRMRVRDNYASVGIHVYVFGGLVVKKKRPSQFSSGCLSFDANFAGLTSSLIFSTFYIENSLECLYSHLFRAQTRLIVTIHNLLFLIIGNYFDFVSQLNSSLGGGYISRLRSKQFSLGVNLIVCLFHFPYPALLGDWLVGIMRQDKRSSAAISFIKEALSYFDPFERKLRGVSLVVKGRIGGADKSVKQVVRWGQMPKETLRAGVISSFSAAFTPQGVIGVRVSLYFVLPGFIFLFLTRFCFAERVLCNGLAY
jgi:hypothetical protein